MPYFNQGNPHGLLYSEDDDLLEQVMMQGVNKPKQAMFDYLMTPSWGSRFIRELMDYFPTKEQKRK
jgi:hypothetical protein